MAPGVLILVSMCRDYESIFQLLVITCNQVESSLGNAFGMWYQINRLTHAGKQLYPINALSCKTDGMWKSPSSNSGKDTYHQQWLRYVLWHISMPVGYRFPIEQPTVDALQIPKGKILRCNLFCGNIAVEQQNFIPEIGFLSSCSIESTATSSPLTAHPRE